MKPEQIPFGKDIDFQINVFEDEAGLIPIPLNGLQGYAVVFYDPATKRLIEAFSKYAVTGFTTLTDFTNEATGQMQGVIKRENLLGLKPGDQIHHQVIHQEIDASLTDSRNMDVSENSYFGTMSKSMYHSPVNLKSA